MESDNRNGIGKMDDIGQLIRYAGPRDVASAERVAAAHARVGAHWESVVASRQVKRNRQRLQYFAIAASVLVAIGAAFLTWYPATAPLQTNLASVNRVIGNVQIDGVAPQPGDVIAADTVIETQSGGRIALDLVNGHSLRVDANSRLEIISTNRFSLDHGAVYADSGTDRPESSIFIATRFGTATDVGTQFQVRVTPDRLQVSVREGVVNLDRPNADLVSIDGGALIELAGNGVPNRREIDGDDPVWNWVSTITPDFDIQGKSLRQYLTWFARERRVLLQWEDVDSRDKASQIRLSGSIRGLSLDDGLVAVSRIAPFQYRMADSAIHVQLP